MKISRPTSAGWFLAFLILSLTGTQAAARYYSKEPWHFEGRKSCTFNVNQYKLKPEVSCKEYAQVVNLRPGKTKFFYVQYKWTAGPLEVRFTPQNGIIYMSSFIVGQLYDNNANFPRHTREAIAHTLSREELVIGTTDDGYLFSVK